VAADIASKVTTKPQVDTVSTVDQVDLLYAVGRNVQDTVSSGDEGQLLHTLFWDDNAVWADTGTFNDTVSGNF
jgi:hypothetical protein